MQEALRVPKNPFDLGYYQSKELREFGFASVGENVQIARRSTIVGLKNISICNNVRIDENVVITAHAGRLTIGSYVHLGAACYLGCAGGIVLSDFCGLSQGVRIYSGSDDYTGKFLTNPTVPREYSQVTLGLVTLERHAIVGSGTVILPGVTIGEGSSVGALSLVSKSLDKWGVYFGVPVRRLKSRSKDLMDLERRLINQINNESAC